MRRRSQSNEPAILFCTNSQKKEKMIYWRSFKIRSTTSKIMAIAAVVLLTLVQLSESNMEHHGPISQISPKSSSFEMLDIGILQQTSRTLLESTMPDSSSSQNEDSPQLPENEPHVRIERSALPILNEKNYPKTGLNDVHFPEEEEKDSLAGRYYRYNIKPTSTVEAKAVETSLKEKKRAGKTLDFTTEPTSATSLDSSTQVSSSFLLKGDLRQDMSGSQINPTSSTVSSAMAAATAPPHSPRQNSNPDIQDIITGIVKLLNGNVNVHANTQGLRRPSASRINNRGPPRISDVPPLPIDYENVNHGTSVRPPPFPFDRPERPFITGVPLPEQIVPLRPGFVSNRPPWHRNKPRPPINTAIGGRRPVPQAPYKPLPTSQMKQPDELPEEEQSHQQPQQMEQETHFSEETTKEPEHNKVNANQSQEDPKPTDTTYDSDFSKEDVDTQYIEVSDDTENTAIETEVEEEPPALPPAPVMNKKEEKKKSNKPKGNDKKKHEYSSIVHTSSEVHTVIGMSSKYVPMPMPSHGEIGVDHSTEEVIFMTPSKTVSLATTNSVNSQIFAQPNEDAIHFGLPPSFKPLEFLEPSPSTSYMEPTIVASTPLISSSLEVTTNSKETNPLPPNTTPTPQPQPQPQPKQPLPNQPNQPQAPAPPSTPTSPYQPRPGIVLDDPEFKPGGRPRPGSPRPAPSAYPAAPPPPQQHPLNIQPTRSHLPPGYGEIFDVTLSAIQGPGNGGGSKQTINIKPFGSYGVGGGSGSGAGSNGDIIVSPEGDDGFVSIDGKRTYINLFGDPTDPPTGVQPATTPATALPQIPGQLPPTATTNPNAKPSGGNSGIGSGVGTGTSSEGPSTPNVLPQVPGLGYGIAETEVVELEGPNTKPKSPVPVQKPQGPTTNTAPTRPHYRPRTTQPPVRIDTCIVGDDSTCDQAQHERCKTENGVSSCHCRPGYSRRKHREPCRRVFNFYIGMRVDRFYEHRIVWDTKLVDRNSEHYGQLSYEAIRAVDSAMSMTPYSDEFMQAKVNNIYRGDPNLGGSGVFVNLTIKLDESVETLRPNLRSDVQKHLLGVLHRRNNNIGNSALYVSSPEGAISALQDLDECESPELNDCHPTATCTNAWGTFRCQCEAGYRDPWADQPARAGRDCQSCSDNYCNNHGTCSYNEEGNQICACDSSHYGGQCEIDGEVLGVAIGASVAAIIIIVLTLVCLIMWSRRWQREQKNAMGSPVFGYMNTAPLKAAGLPQAGYQVTLEDRMRWAQIADVMAQTNHYGSEPMGPTRPSSAMFGYPNLAQMGMGTIGGMSMQSTLQMHQNAMGPPVPLPRRLGLSSRSNGMRTLENSSSSEEEDRTDLLGRNFQVPRPKSRSNGSIANQSGIYYDVDYEPSGNGIGNTSVDHLYGSQNQSTTHSHIGSSSHIPGPQGIPMSTYTSGRAPSSYYMK